MVTRDHARLSDVHSWYRATLAKMAASDLWNVKHSDAAAEAHPPDADLLFLAGSHHEAVASPRVQAAIAACHAIAPTAASIGG